MVEMVEGRTLPHRVVVGERLTDGERGHGHVIRVEGDEADIIWGLLGERVKLPPEQAPMVRLYVPYLHKAGHGFAILDWPKMPYSPEDINSIREAIAKDGPDIRGEVIPLGFQVLE